MKLRPFFLWLSLILICLALPGGAVSQNETPDQARRVQVPLNGVKVITTEHPVNRVVTGKTEMLSVKMASSREIMVFGLQTGVSTLHVWTERGLKQYFLVIEEATAAGLETDLQSILRRQGQATSKDGTVMRVFSPQYRKVSEFERILNELLGDKGRILLSDPPSGKIFVVGPAKLLNEAKQLIGRLDVPGEDKRFTKRIVLQNRPAKEMQPKVKKLLTKDGKVIVDEETNSLLVIDNVQKVNEIASYLNNIDVPTVAQVRIEARFVELTDEATKQLGINWNIRGTANDATIVSQFGPPVAGASGLQLDFTELGTPGLDATLRALEEKNLLNLISSPNVVTRNQQQAVLEILNERSFVSGFTVNQIEGAQAIEPEIDTVEDGITLKVTPLIGNNDVIQLDVVPELQIAELTRVTQDLGVGNATFFTPSVDRRRAELNVAIKDGQTLVIGGLNRQEKSTSTTEVPLLSDIPGIGWAFKQKETVTDNRNISIFLTAEIVKLKQTSPSDTEAIDPTVSKKFRDTGPIGIQQDPFQE